MHYLIEISGETQSILDKSIEDFMDETVIPLVDDLANPGEEVVVRIGKIHCHCVDSSPHTCLTKITMHPIDKHTRRN